MAVAATALDAITTGDHNVAVGYDALGANTTASFNTATGAYSLNKTTTGAANTAAGSYALRNNTEGSSNTALGSSAGSVITTGSNNVILGYGSDPSANNATNQIVIGQGATGQADNSVVLGNTDVTAVYASQDAGATLHAGALNIGGTAVTSTAAELNLLDGVTALGASNVTGLSDALVEDNSMYVGNDPSSTTDAAQ